MEIVGIIALVGLAVWWMNRRRKRKAGSVRLTTTYVRREAPTPREQTWLSKEQADAELIRHDDGSLGVRVDRRDEGLWFVSTESSLRAGKGNLALARLGIFYFRVRGTNYYEPASIPAGAEIPFRREPDNPYGSTAIALLNPRTGSPYGYVNKGFSRRVSKRIDAGEDWVAISMSREGLMVALLTRDLAKEVGLLRKY